MSQLLPIGSTEETSWSWAVPFLSHFLEASLKTLKNWKVSKSWFHHPMVYTICTCLGGWTFPSMLSQGVSHGRTWLTSWSRSHRTSSRNTDIPEPWARDISETQNNYEKKDAPTKLIFPPFPRFKIEKEEIKRFYISHNDFQGAAFFLQETISYYKKLSLTLAEKLRNAEDTFKAIKGR